MTCERNIHHSYIVCDYLGREVLRIYKLYFMKPLTSDNPYNHRCNKKDNK